jgi:hypothetical protein
MMRYDDCHDHGSVIADLLVYDQHQQASHNQGFAKAESLLGTRA